MNKLLIFWDIDGTLLHSGGAGMRALAAALDAVYGISDPIADIEYAGRTDLWIARRILEKFGISASPVEVGRLLDGYLSLLPAHMESAGARVLPGVETLLESVGSRADASQGLLTGNLRRGAETKLGYHGLWHHFPFGAFADDSERRNELGPHALRRASEHCGATFDLRRVWVVGDTPYDIECAKAVGARSLAVATGGSTAAALARHHPDAILEDLADSPAFWRVLEAS